MTASHAASPGTSHHLALEEQRWLTALRAHRKSHREKAARRDEHRVEAAPAIMMSQNRQSEIDRRRAENDYEINVKAELEIELLHEKIDVLKAQELPTLTQAVRDLSSQLTQLSARLHPEPGTRKP